MTISGEFQNGIKWYGTKGWIFVQRDGMNSPTAKPGDPVPKVEVLQASDPKILDQRDRAERNSSVYQRRPAWELAGLHSEPAGADSAAGDWAPGVLDMPGALDCDEDEAAAPLGSEGGTLYQ